MTPPFLAESLLEPTTIERTCVRRFWRNAISSLLFQAICCLTDDDDDDSDDDGVARNLWASGLVSNYSGSLSKRHRLNRRITGLIEILYDTYQSCSPGKLRVWIRVALIPHKSAISVVGMEASSNTALCVSIMGVIWMLGITYIYCWDCTPSYSWRMTNFLDAGTKRSKKIDRYYFCFLTSWKLKTFKRSRASPAAHSWSRRSLSVLLIPFLLPDKSGTPKQPEPKSWTVLKLKQIELRRRRQRPRNGTNDRILGMVNFRHFANGFPGSELK